MANGSTLALTSLIDIAGDFPQRGTGGTTPVFTLGMIQTMAPVLDAFGAPDAQGQQFAVISYAAHLSVTAIEDKFDLGYHFQQVDTIFARVFGND